MGSRESSQLAMAAAAAMPPAAATLAGKMEAGLQPVGVFLFFFLDNAGRGDTDGKEEQMGLFPLLVRCCDGVTNGVDVQFR